MRRTNARHGTAGGHLLWTPEEDDVLRRLYPDYETVGKLLPKRSYYAIRGRAEGLRIQRKRHVWTGADISRLRKLYPTATHAQLVAAFPGATLNAIQSAARRKRILRARYPLKKTGHRLVDAIRMRCFVLGYNMRDLDKLARTGTYFRCSCRGPRSHVSMVRLCKAVKALGGSLSVQWDE